MASSAAPLANTLSQSLLKHADAWLSNSDLTEADRATCLVEALRLALSSVPPPAAAPKPTTDAIAPANTAGAEEPVRVYVDGCFDIMHSGHYNMLRQAKNIFPNTTLVVGVHSDAEILLNKGPSVMKNEERLAMVRACKWADEVVFDTPYSPSVALLDREDVRCKYCVHGDDLPVAADGTNAYDEVQRAGRLQLVKRTEGVSTTDLVARLLLMTTQHLNRARQAQSSAEAAAAAAAVADGSSSSGVSGSDFGTLAASVSCEGEWVGSGSGGATEQGAEGEAKQQQQQPPPLPPSPQQSPPSPPPPRQQFLPTSFRISQFSNHRPPSLGDTVIYIDGSFDLFHAGHVATLRRAKALGSYLLVGVHSDMTVNAARGRNYPVMDLHERVLNVLSCASVDDVIMGAPWAVTRDMLRTFNIARVVAGSNTKMEPGAGAVPPSEDPHAVPKQLGLYCQLDTSSELTTDHVVQRIIDNRVKYINRNAVREKKELSYLNNDKVFVEEH